MSPLSYDHQSKLLFPFFILSCSWVAMNLVCDPLASENLSGSMLKDYSCNCKIVHCIPMALSTNFRGKSPQSPMVQVKLVAN